MNQVNLTVIKKKLLWEIGHKDVGKGKEKSGNVTKERENVTQGIPTCLGKAKL